MGLDEVISFDDLESLVVDEDPSDLGKSEGCRGRLDSTTLGRVKDLFHPQQTAGQSRERLVGFEHFEP